MIYGPLFRSFIPLLFDLIWKFMLSRCKGHGMFWIKEILSISVNLFLHSILFSVPKNLSFYPLYSSFGQLNKRQDDLIGKIKWEKRKKNWKGESYHGWIVVIERDSMMEDDSCGSLLLDFLSDFISLKNAV